MDLLETILRSSGFKEYQENFQNHGIDSYTLKILNDQDLQILGIENKEKRKEFLKILSNLQIPAEKKISLIGDKLLASLILHQISFQLTKQFANLTYVLKREDVGICDLKLAPAVKSLQNILSSLQKSVNEYESKILKVPKKKSRKKYVLIPSLLVLIATLTMYDDENEITVDEVNKVLSEIENKYSQLKTPNHKDCFDENLVVLSREFDSVGVQPIDLSKPLSKVFKQVVSGARTLVQIHRKTIADVKDVNINIQGKISKTNQLHSIVKDRQTKINACETQNAVLQNKISILENQLSDQKKKETELKNEMDKIKRFYNSQKCECTRYIQKLSDENDRLKKLLGSDINISHSKDEVVLNCIKKYKHNEEIYKDTINKLQENNHQLLEELVDIKSKGKLREK